MTRDDANFDPHVEPREIASRDADDEQSAIESSTDQGGAAGAIGDELPQRSPGRSPSDLRQHFADAGERDAVSSPDAKGAGTTTTSGEESANEEIARRGEPREDRGGDSVTSEPSPTDGRDQTAVPLPPVPLQSTPLAAPPPVGEELLLADSIASTVGGATPINPSLGSTDSTREAAQPITSPEAEPAGESRPSESMGAAIAARPPALLVGAGGQGERRVKRLEIEVEVTVSNAQRVSQIAIQTAKEEFVRLSRAGADEANENLREFYDNQYLIWGR